MPLNVAYLTAKTDKASDEYYTPAYAVEPLLKYIAPFRTVWCPFDTEYSQYVNILRNNGNKVIATHIDDGKNFFFYEPDEEYDCIISNPPFSVKDMVLKRLYELNKPYAMLLPVPTLQGQKRFEYIKDCQVLLFDKRVSYYTDITQTKLSNNVCFGSCYICRNFLPKDLIFEELII